MNFSDQSFEKEKYIKDFIYKNWKEIYNLKVKLLEEWIVLDEIKIIDDSIFAEKEFMLNWIKFINEKC